MIDELLDDCNGGRRLFTRFCFASVGTVSENCSFWMHVKRCDWRLFCVVRRSHTIGAEQFGASQCIMCPKIELVGSKI